MNRRKRNAEQTKPKPKPDSTRPNESLFLIKELKRGRKKELEWRLDKEKTDQRAGRFSYCFARSLRELKQPGEKKFEPHTDTQKAHKKWPTNQVRTPPERDKLARTGNNGHRGRFAINHADRARRN